MNNTRSAAQSSSALSSSQEEYFKNSVVRDENGNLLKVYHGTSSQTMFTSFNANLIGNVNGTGNGAGFNFTDDLLVAKHYAGENGHIYECYLNIEKPLHSDDVSLTNEDIEKFFYGTISRLTDLSESKVDINTQVHASFEKLLSEIKEKGSNPLHTDFNVLEEISEAITDLLYSSDDAIQDFRTELESHIIDKYIDEHFDEITEEYGEEWDYDDLGISTDAMINNLISSTVNEESGHDGFIGTMYGGGQVFVALRPNQIKSTNNLTPTNSPDMFDNYDIITIGATQDGIETQKSQSQSIEEDKNMDGIRTGEFEHETSLSSEQKLNEVINEVEALTRGSSEMDAFISERFDYSDIESLNDALEAGYIPFSTKYGTMEFTKSGRIEYDGINMGGSSELHWAVEAILDGVRDKANELSPEHDSELTISDFARTIQDRLGKELSSQYPVSGIELQNTLKNNGQEYTGIVVKREDVNIAPVIYINDYFDSFVDGDKGLDDIVRDIADVYRSHTIDNSLDTTQFMDFNNVRDKVVAKLVNAERNPEYLGSHPHRMVGDLALTYIVPMNDIDSRSPGFANISVTNDHMRMWGIDEDALYRASTRNTEPVVKTLGQVMCELQRIEYDPAYDPAPIAVITNDEKTFGAGAVVSPDIKDRIDEVLGDNPAGYFILPSSVHELLAIPVDFADSTGGIDQLKGIVMEVNQAEVTPADFLSDNIYSLSESGQLSLTHGTEKHNEHAMAFNPLDLDIDR